MKVLLNPSPLCVRAWQDGWESFLLSRAIEPDQAEHWDWQEKALTIGRDRKAMLVALADDDEVRCHGLMLVLWPYPSRLADGSHAAYIDYLQAAPWNQWAFGVSREHAGIGLLLMSYAIEISYDKDFKGRVNLVSLPQAEKFYQRIGMTEIGVGEGRDAKLKFFEFDAAAAKDFLNQFEV